MSIDLLGLINFTSPAAASAVKRSPAGSEGDPWPGIDTWTAGDFQAALDTLVEGPGPLPSGAALHANVAAYLASLPTPAQIDEARKDGEADRDLATAFNKVLLAELWNMEMARRGGARDAEIAAAASKAEYGAILKSRIKVLLP